MHLRRSRLPAPRRRRARPARRARLIARAGGGIVEGYPHDTQGKKVSASFLYNTTRTTYERCGFVYDRPKGEKNTVMVTTVAPA